MSFFTNPHNGDRWSWNGAQNEMIITNSADQKIERPLGYHKNSPLTKSSEINHIVFTSEKNRAWVSFTGFGADDYPYASVLLIDMNGLYHHGPGIRYYAVASGFSGYYGVPDVFMIEDLGNDSVRVADQEHQLEDFVQSERFRLISLALKLGSYSYYSGDIKKLMANITGMSVPELEVTAKATEEKQNTLATITPTNGEKLPNDENIEHILRYWVKRCISETGTLNFSIDVELSETKWELLMHESAYEILATWYNYNK